jgi:hypothetical protein
MADSTPHNTRNVHRHTEDGAHRNGSGSSSEEAMRRLRPARRQAVWPVSFGRLLLQGPPGMSVCVCVCAYMYVLMDHSEK